MAKEPPLYRKLPGRGSSAMEMHRLYQAPDHLLLVSSTGFSETYRRFYFRDIQAFTVRKSVTGPVQNGLLGLFAFFSLVGMLSGGPPITTAWLIGWSIPLVFFLALLAVNVVRGPTCVCEIHTAVQSRRLGSLNRLRTARKFIERLRPIIEAAQGPVPPEELRQRIDAARQQAFTAAAPPVIGQQTWR